MAERKLRILVVVSTIVSILMIYLCGSAANFLFTLQVNSIYLHYLLIAISFIPAFFGAGFVISLYFLAKLWLELKEPM